MLRIKPNLNYLVIFAAIAGLVFVIGCASSKEKQQMTQVIDQIGKTLDEYAKADGNQKAELEEKLVSYMEKWSHMRMEMGGNIAPHTLDKLDSEFQDYEKEFKKLSGKS
jgi:mevalonate kinase